MCCGVNKFGIKCKETSYFSYTITPQENIKCIIVDAIAVLEMHGNLW